MKFNKCNIIQKINCTKFKINLKLFNTIIIYNGAKYKVYLIFLYDIISSSLMQIPSFFSTGFTI
jgi:hypothetical protein